MTMTMMIVFINQKVLGALILIIMVMVPRVPRVVPLKEMSPNIREEESIRVIIMMTMSMNIL